MAINAAAVAAREASRDHTTGRFGEQHHSKPGRLLDGLSRDEEQQLLEDAHRYIAKLARERYIRTQGSLYQWDVETLNDVISDTKVDFLKHLRKKQVECGKLDYLAAKAELAVIPSKLRVYAQRNSFATDRFSDEDVAAYKFLQEDMEAFRLKHGREMTKAERDKHANWIREYYWEEGDRPHEGFQNQTGNDSLNRLVGNPESDGNRGEMGDFIADDRTMNPDMLIDDLDPRSRALNQLDDWEAETAERRGHAWAEKERLGLKHVPEYKKAARRDYGLTQTNSWNLVAGATGTLPHSYEGDLPRRARKKASDQLKRSGGINEVVKRAERGVCESEELDALYAPWPHITASEERRVLALMSKHPDIAEKLWNSAASLAGPAEKPRKKAS